MDPREFEAFLFHEARLLDDRRFRDWMELFTEDGSYWIPAVPEQESPFDQASLFYDDRELMKTRIARLQHPRIHVQTPPSRTAHLIANIVIESPPLAGACRALRDICLERGDAGASLADREAVEGEPPEYLVSSTVIMVEYRNDKQRIFAGRQQHRLRREGGSFKIVRKRVDLINCDSAFEAIAVPI